MREGLKESADQVSKNAIEVFVTVAQQRTAMHRSDYWRLHDDSITDR